VEFLSGLGNPPAFANVDDLIVDINLSDLKSQQIELGEIYSFAEGTTTSLSSFEVSPASASQFIQFNFEQSSLFVDYESLNRLNGDFA
jgi:hypothetical protein